MSDMQPPSPSQGERGLVPTLVINSKAQDNSHEEDIMEILDDKENAEPARTSSPTVIRVRGKRGSPSASSPVSGAPIKTPRLSPEDEKMEETIVGMLARRAAKTADPAHYQEAIGMLVDLPEDVAPQLLKVVLVVTSALCSQMQESAGRWEDVDQRLSVIEKSLYRLDNAKGNGAVPAQAKKELKEVTNAIIQLRTDNKAITDKLPQQIKSVEGLSAVVVNNNTQINTLGTKVAQLTGQVSVLLEMEKGKQQECGRCLKTGNGISAESNTTPTPSPHVPAPNAVKCILCSEGHQEHDCETYSTAEQRTLRMKQLALCEQCGMSTKHTECPMKDAQCTQCKDQWINSGLPGGHHLEWMCPTMFTWAKANARERARLGRGRGRGRGHYRGARIDRRPTLPRQFQAPTSVSASITPQ